MILRFQKALMQIIFGSLIGFSALAAPADPSLYYMDQGPFLDLKDGSIVQGSVVGGGTQPDYVIDTTDPALKNLWNYSKKVGKSDLSYWEKVEKIRRYILRYALPFKDYDDPTYTKLINKYRRKKQDIPISKYVECGAGVCRENGMLLHLALKLAGIPSHYVYAKIHRSSYSVGYDIVEDHGFTVVEFKGEKWVVDSYYWGFNGFLLKDLMRPEGITERSRTAPIADPGPGFRNIIELRNYPAWHPRPSCSKIHLN